jgi:hypothetical protein
MIRAGALHRLKGNGEVLRFKDGWALAELYPASLRSSLGKESQKPAKPARRVKKNVVHKRAPKAIKSEPQREQSTDPSKAKSENKTEAILTMLTAFRGITPDDLHVALREAGIDCKPNYVFNVLSRLKQQGKAEKRDGRWYPPGVAA